MIPWRESAYKNPEGLWDLALQLQATGREVYFLSPHPPSDPARMQAFPGRWTINPAQSELPRIYSTCDFVMTRSKSEGHSVITLEAMAVGAIPVVQEVGNIGTVVPGTGLLLPDNATTADYLAAVTQLEGQRCGWRHRRQKGRDAVGKFDWPPVIERWSALLARWLEDGYGPTLQGLHS